MTHTWHEQVETADRRTSHKATPTWTSDGIPHCYEGCPNHDGKRCMKTGFRVPEICEPVVTEMSALLDNLRPVEALPVISKFANQSNVGTLFYSHIGMSQQLHDRLISCMARSKMTEGDFIAQAISHECDRWDEPEDKHEGVPCTDTSIYRTAAP